VTAHRAFIRAAAHTLLLGRHHNTIIIGGLHWTYCIHRSHRLRLPCWRWSHWDGYCRRHIGTCWSSCTETAP